MFWSARVTEADVVYWGNLVLLGLPPVLMKRLVARKDGELFEDVQNHRYTCSVVYLGRVSQPKHKLYYWAHR